MSFDIMLLPLVTPLSRAFLYAPIALGLLGLLIFSFLLVGIALALPRHGTGSSNSNVISGNRIARNDPRIIQPRKYWTGD